MGGYSKIGGSTDLRTLKIPDYSIYKVTKEKTPKLWQFQEKLAREGLKDPWLRNLVWRYEKSNIPFLKRYSCIIVGIIAGFGVFGGFVYIDKTRHCQWHHPHVEKYKLLYQLKDDEKANSPHH